MFTIKLYRGDCLDMMKKIPDSSVDCIICDLPYGTTRNRWDTIIPFQPLWDEYKRVAKDSAAKYMADKKNASEGENKAKR